MALNREALALKHEKLKEADLKFKQEEEKIRSILNPNHPKYPDYQRLSAEAASKIAQIGLLTTMGDGAGALLAYERLGQIYDDIVQIRIEMLQSQLATEGQSDKQFDSLFQANGGKNAFSDIRQDMERMLFPPTDRKNPFFQRQGESRPALVNFGKIAEVRAQLQRMKATNVPGIDRVEPAMEARLRMLESTDPVRQGYSELNQTIRQMKGEFDWRPLRTIGVMAGGLLFTLGAGLSLHSGEFPSWPTWLWGAVMMFSKNPAMLQGRAGEVVTAFEKTRPAMDLLKKFTGSDLKELRLLLDKNKDFRKLNSGNMQQLTLFLKDSPQLLASFGKLSSDQDRLAVLQMIGKNLSKQEVAFIAMGVDEENQASGAPPTPPREGTLPPELLTPTRLS